MAERQSDLQAFVDALHAGLLANLKPGTPGMAATHRMFAALETPAEPGAVTNARLPVCKHLDTAFAVAEAGAPEVAAVSRAFRTLAPDLAWKTRPGSARNETFANGHANATIIGAGGLEPRKDVLVGVSLVAPGITYPDHEHPPEEVYLVLSGGDWRQGSNPWHTPGIGGTVYNPHGIVHAMRANETPLLAVWSLWLS